MDMVRDCLDWEIKDFLSIALKTVSDFGYDKERFMGRFQETLDNYNEAKASDKSRFQADSKLVEGFLQWNAKREATNDFERNAKNVIAYGYVNVSRHAKIIGAYSLKFFKELATAGNKNEYLGNVGDKVEFTINSSSDVVCLYVKTVQIGWNTYSRTPVLKITDSEGRTVIYKGNVLPYAEVWPNPIKVRATIKETSEYKGEKQTVIQRPKLFEVIDGKEVAI